MLACRTGRMAVLAALALAAPAAAQTAARESGGASPDAVRSLIAPVVEGRRGDVGVAVYSVDRERALYLHRADASLLPASNMKLYTTAAALDRLGPDFQYTTSIYADGPIRPDGTLDGNLILVGRGDPTISGRFYGDSATYVFDRFAERLRAAGIRRISGRVIGDASYFDDVRIAPGWDSGNLLWWYGARVSALAFNDNVVTLSVNPGPTPGSPAWVSFYPASDDLPVVNRATTATRSGGRSVGIARRGGGYEVWGRVPVGGAPVRYVVSLDDPARFAVTVFRDRLERAGIDVGGGVQVVHDRDDLPSRPRTLLASHTSPRMLEIVRVINKRSQNFFAEQVLKTLGAVIRDDGSFQDGREVVASFVRGLGVRTDDLWVADGSGLSRLDRTSARTTAELLVAMSRHPRFDHYYHSLLEAGVDGDPRRLDSPDAVGNVRTKTGTLGGVSALSGYVTTRDGELLAFSVITNGVGGKWSSIAIEDAVAERLAGYTAWHPPLPLRRDVGR